LKTRLALEEFNVEFDSLLTNALDAISARFDHECNRTFTRAETSRTNSPVTTSKSCPNVTPLKPSQNSNSKKTKPTAGSNNPTSHS